MYMVFKSKQSIQVCIIEIIVICGFDFNIQIFLSIFMRSEK